jgi:PTH1 family peptidyl-tRNA hydrolase
MFLIIGQGNPGPQYARTKHNVGFWVLDKLSPDFRLKGSALMAELKLGDQSGWAIKPATFYNATGTVVAPFARYHKVPPERILVVHDELDLPPGKIRFKAGGGLAGNYGLGSIAEHLGTQDFHRLRIGIGKPPSKEEGAGWVLNGFRPEIAPMMDKVIETCAEAVKLWVLEGFEGARKKYNGLDFAAQDALDNPV